MKLKIYMHIIHWDKPYNLKRIPNKISSPSGPINIGIEVKIIREDSNIFIIPYYFLVTF